MQIPGTPGPDKVKAQGLFQRERIGFIGSQILVQCGAFLCQFRSGSDTNRISKVRRNFHEGGDAGLIVEGDDGHWQVVTIDKRDVEEALAGRREGEFS